MWLETARRSLAIAAVAGATWLAAPPDALGQPSDADSTPRPSVLRQIEAETAELFRGVRGSIVSVQLPRPAAADPSHPPKNPAEIRPEPAGRGGSSQPAPPAAPTLHAAVVAPTPGGDPSAAPSTRPVEIPWAPGETVEPLPQAMGVQIDPLGHVLLPIYLPASDPPATLRAWSLDGRQTIATVVGSDVQTGITLLRLRDAIAVPLPRPSGFRPAGDSMVLLVPSAQESPRLVLWTPHAEEKGLVVDLDGRCRGFARQGQFVSIEGTRAVVEQLASHGRVDRPKLGVWIIEQRISGERRDASMPPGQTVLQVQLVVEDTPAGRAGVRGGDCIIGLGGRDVDDLTSFAAAIAGLRGPTTLRVLRDGRPIDLAVTLD